LDDGTTYELLARGDTLGVFQLDGGPMRALLKLMKPDSFEDISAVLALYRPGPMGVDSHTNYALRKIGQQDIKPIHPELEAPLKEILGPTYGLIVYQEQVQKAAQILAGYSLGQADLLRRAMGKKKPEVLAKEFVPFRQGCREHGYSDEAIQAVWDVLVPFSGYAFNKSHTVAYGMVSYWTAYLKANYPAEFMAALLTSMDNDKDKSAVYLAECRKMGIKILSPDVNESVADFSAVGDDIRFGLKSVRNVGSNVIESLVKTRKEKGKYTSFADFLDKSEISVCNKRTIDSLIKAGSFDSLGHTRKGLCDVHETAVDSIIPVKKQQAIGQDDLFGSIDTGEDIPTIGLDFQISEQEWNRKAKLSLEREMLGLYVSAHPLDGAEHILARNRETSIPELLSSGRTEGEAKVAGLITAVDKRINKRGDPWAIVTVTDRDASLEVLFFPKTYPLYVDALLEDTAVTVKGRLNDRDGTYSMFTSEMSILDISHITEGEPPVLLSVAEDRLNPELVDDLRQVLSSHKGDTPVRIRVDNPVRSRIYAVDYSVRISPEFNGEMKSLLGAYSVDY
jgi:DNA polymerase III subunit alpha